MRDHQHPQRPPTDDKPSRTPPDLDRFENEGGPCPGDTRNQCRDAPSEAADSRGVASPEDAVMGAQPPRIVSFGPTTIWH